MQITPDKIVVIREPNEDPNDPRPWFRVIVYLPQLHMISARCFTAEHAHELVDDILSQDAFCKYCGFNNSMYPKLSWKVRLLFKWRIFKRKISRKPYTRIPMVQSI